MNHRARRPPPARATALALALSSLAPLGCAPSDREPHRAPEAPSLEARAPERGATRLAGRHVELELPARDGAIVLRDRRSPVRLALTLRGASSERLGRALGPPGATSYDDSPAPGQRHEVHPIEGGLEDLVHLPTRPEREELSYELDLTDVAGLRMLAGALELLDERGAPRLRAAPPFVLDAHGARHPATLELPDCPFDGDARPPWGRPTTRPPPRCTLTVRWGAPGRPLSYPIVVDPAWTSTASMMAPRGFHTASLVLGRVLVWGGDDGGAPAELFDPASDTWAIAGQPTLPRRYHTAVSTGDQVLALGGTDPAEAAVTDVIERYHGESGEFEVVGATLAPRIYHTSTLLPDGRVLTVGGIDLPYSLVTGEESFSEAELFDPATLMTSSAGVESPRLGHTATLLSNGRVLVAGGATYALSTNDPEQPTASSALFEPSTGVFSPAGAMHHARDEHLMLALPDGRALALGGWQNGLGPVMKTETFDPATSTWTLTDGQLALMRLSSTVAPMANGGVLVAGGCCVTDTTEIFWPLDGTWSLAEPLPEPSIGPTSTLLPDGRVLLAGGLDAQGSPLAQSHLLDLSPLGAPSVSPVACKSGLVSSGVCCDAPCEASCESCLASEKGHGQDGACERVGPDALDPKGVCVDELGPSCGATGRCTESGACALYEAGTTCATTGCTFEAGQCDGAGACVCPPPACSADQQYYGDVDCAPYKCGGDGCPSTCASSDECLAPYLCDRTSHCVLPTTASSAGGGCSLSAPLAGPAGRSGAPLALLSLALLAMSARRRRAPTAGRSLSAAALVSALGSTTLGCSAAPSAGEPGRGSTPDPIEPALDPGLGAEVTLEPLSTLRREGSTITLPARASGPVGLRTADMGLRFVLASARPAPARTEGPHATYEGALGPKTSMWLRATRDGVEDHVRFDERPDRTYVRYLVDVSEAAGLRLVGNVLELVDAGGAPRLRVAPPYVLDARGARRDARLTLTNCAHDTDPAPPWGRGPTAPGRSWCALDVSFQDEGLVYPVTVDPLWEPTSSLATARMNHQVTVVGAGPHAGKVVVTGGMSHDNIGAGDPSGVALDTVELFDPATATWAASAPMPTARRAHSASYVELASGPTVLVAGGCDFYVTGPCRTDTVYVHDVASGAWTEGPTLPEARGAHWHVTLADGRVLVAGGLGPTLVQPAVMFDPLAESWSYVAPATKVRAGPVVVPLPDGRALVAGGLTLDQDLQQFDTDDVELYDPSADAWLPTGKLSLPRRAHRGVLLASGEVLVAGGLHLVSELSMAEVWSPATGVFAPVGVLGESRNQHAMVALPNGGALVLGGVTSPTPEVYDPTLGSWSSAAPELDDAWRHAQTAQLLDGRALFLGGILQAEYPAATDRVVLVSTAALASACASNMECASGSCVEGVCCDTPCDQGCMACTASAKGHGVDGACEPVGDGLPDAKGSCGASASAPCGADGTCDGLGACTVPAAGTTCAACPANHVGACDGVGACLCEGPTCLDAQTLRTADGETLDCAPYRCEADDCAHACNTGTDCAEGYTCDATYQCIPFGDGAGGALPAPSPVAGGGCALGARGRAHDGRGAMGPTLTAMIAAMIAARARRRARSPSAHRR